MKHITAVYLFVMLTGMAIAQPVIELEELTLTGASISSPVDITGSGDGSGRLFVVEKAGYIKIIDGTTVLQDDFLDIHTNVASGGERGLLGLAFHPNFPGTPYLYVHYVKPDINESSSVDDTSMIARFTVNSTNPDDAREASELLILKQAQPYSNHNAGDLAFGPDGYLYIPFGDGGSGGDPEESGQDSTSWLGKILRVDVDNVTNPHPDTNYSVPVDNPYVDNDNIRSEIWAFGVRNPWRISFDCVTGDLWIGDVGQGMWEEVNRQLASSPGGENYGWDCYEGNHAFELTNCAGALNYTPPVFEYPHNCSQGCPVGTGNSITGGFVYRGSDFPSLNGYYIVADYGSEKIWLISPSLNVSDATPDPISYNQLAAFGEGDDKELYACVLSGSDIYRITVPGVLPLYFVALTGERLDADVRIQWKVENTEGIKEFQVQKSENSFSAFETVGKIEVDGNNTKYAFLDKNTLATTLYYRIKAKMLDGQEELSSILSVPLAKLQSRLSVYTAGNGQLTIRSPQLHQDASIAIYSLDGKLLQTHELGLLNDTLIPGTAPLQSGMYVVSLSGLEGDDVAFKWIKGD